MYFWRKLTKEQQDAVLKSRMLDNHPWHSPPHMQNNKENFHITASCYEHKRIIGESEERLSNFERELLELLNTISEEVFSWAVMPNHYHILIKSYDINIVLKLMGKLHGRTSFKWNGEDNHRGRKVWFNALEHGIKSERHFWATMNYIHNNPVKHGYVKKWQDWKYSSAVKFIDEVGVDNAKVIWKEYDISKMGNWDVY